MVADNRDICEGVTLTVLPFDKSKSNYMLVKLSAPLREETATHYSLLTNVLSRCCEEFPTLMSFNTALEELYAADLNAWVEKEGEVQNVCFKLSCIENEYTYDGTDVLAGGMRLLGLMIFRPLLENGVFPRYIIESEKKNLKEEIESLKEDKEQYAVERCISTACDDEAFKVQAAGDVHVLEGIDGAGLKAAYDALIKNAPVSIYFAGRTDADTVLEYCRRHLPFAPRKRVLYKTEVRAASGRIKTVTEPADAVQSKLCMAFRTTATITEENYDALLLALHILGSSYGKLYANVREKLGLCYYCSQIFDGIKGLLIISAGIDGADRERAEKAVTDQIEELKNGVISEKELASAKAEALTSCKQIYDSPGALLSWYSLRKGLGLDMMPEDVTGRILNADISGISAAADTLAADTFYMLEGREAEEE